MPKLDREYVIRSVLQEALRRKVSKWRESDHPVLEKLANEIYRAAKDPRPSTRLAKILSLFEKLRSDPEAKEAWTFYRRWLLPRLNHALNQK